MLLLMEPKDMVSTRFIVQSSARTAVFNSVLSIDGTPIVTVGDMDILGTVTPDMMMEHKAEIENASLVVVDANFSSDVIRTVAEISSSAGVPVWFQPTSIEKCIRGVQSWDKFHFSSPNLMEWATMHASLTGLSPPTSDVAVDAVFEAVSQVCWI